MFLSQVSFLPRTRWVSRNTVIPACCSVSVDRLLGPKKQAGSFNERRELQTLSWRQRIERGCYATWTERHSSEADPAGSVLEGPLTECRADSWYIVVGAALPAVRSSPFCEGELLNHLNEALMDTTADWTCLPPCDSCHVFGADSILSSVADLCSLTGGVTGTNQKRRCLVFGSPSVWGPFESQLDNLILTFSAEPAFARRGCVTLHDGEPLYQRQLLGCVVLSLQTLSCGDALLLPVLSALTRITAAAVLCLHVCFSSVRFRQPPPPARVGSVLVCVGFCPEAAARILPVLMDVRNRMDRLRAEEDSGKDLPPGSGRQVLQFVPMEEMLTGGLTEFLWTMNCEIIQQKLHLLMQP